MPITVNLRHLEKKAAQLEGELDVDELELPASDELVHPKENLKYNLTVERNSGNLLIHGALRLKVDCECARCLKPFRMGIELDPYDALVPLEGEEKAPVDNDCVDLTPYLREDILLAFPQHPLCDKECGGLLFREPEPSPVAEKPSAWAELNKLKF